MFDIKNLKAAITCYNTGVCTHIHTATVHTPHISL